MKKIIFTIILLTSVFTNGQIINVPTDQPTIQAGIDAAVNGDTVLVTEGRYYENINFRGKAITVSSHFLLDQDTAHISKTIIDGSQPSHPDTGSVVVFNSGEDTSSVLCGFSITGGTGTISPPEPVAPNERDLRGGGGISCTLSGAKICHNKVYLNSVDHDPFGFGGGISCGGLPNTKLVIIEGNEVFNNSVTATKWTKGGGIGVATSAIIKNNKIHNNTVTANFVSEYYVAAGGIWSSSEVDSNRKVIISGNHIYKNAVVSTNPNMNDVRGAGAVIYNPELVFEDNIIEQNTISSRNYSYGAGLMILGVPAKSIIKNNLITNNKSLLGKCYGGGLAIWFCAPEISNNIIANNSAESGGGICFAHEYLTPKLINNTIIKNSAKKGGGVSMYSSKPIILNSILWENTAFSGSQIYKQDASVNVLYSNIQDGWSGEGNIDSDPSFTLSDSLFRLSNDSPCIGAGIDSIEINETVYRSPSFDYFGSPRPNPVDEFVDIGAIESEFLLVGVEEIFESFPISFSLFQNYPNPFNPTTTIKYELPKDVKRKTKNVKLVVYDILGREVATLVNEKQKPGNYKVNWDASNQPSGVYFYRLKTDSYVETKKMILLR